MSGDDVDKNNDSTPPVEDYGLWSEETRTMVQRCKIMIETYANGVYGKYRDDDSIPSTTILSLQDTNTTAQQSTSRRNYSENLTQNISTHTFTNTNIPEEVLHRFATGSSIQNSVEQNPSTNIPNSLTGTTVRKDAMTRTRDSNILEKDPAEMKPVNIFNLMTSQQDASTTNYCGNSNQECVGGNTSICGNYMETANQKNPWSRFISQSLAGMFSNETESTENYHGENQQETQIRNAPESIRHFNRNESSNISYYYQPTTEQNTTVKNSTNTFPDQNILPNILGDNININTAIQQHSFIGNSHTQNNLEQNLQFRTVPYRDMNIIEQGAGALNPLENFTQSYGPQYPSTNNLYTDVNNVEQQHASIINAIEQNPSAHMLYNNTTVPVNVWTLNNPVNSTQSYWLQFFSSNNPFRDLNSSRQGNSLVVFNPRNVAQNYASAQNSLSSIIYNDRGTAVQENTRSVNNPGSTTSSVLDPISNILNNCTDLQFISDEGQTLPSIEPVDIFFCQNFVPNDILNNISQQKTCDLSIPEILSEYSFPMYIPAYSKKNGLVYDLTTTYTSGKSTKDTVNRNTSTTNISKTTVATNAIVEQNTPIATEESNSNINGNCTYTKPEENASKKNSNKVPTNVLVEQDALGNNILENPSGTNSNQNSTGVHDSVRPIEEENVWSILPSRSQNICINDCVSQNSSEDKENESKSSQPMDVTSKKQKKVFRPLQFLDYFTRFNNDEKDQDNDSDSDENVRCNSYQNSQQSYNVNHNQNQSENRSQNKKKNNGENQQNKKPKKPRKPR